jgi:hypothetical protein
MLLLAAQGSGDLGLVKVAGAVLGVLILYWAIRRMFGSGGRQKKRRR